MKRLVCLVLACVFLCTTVAFAHPFSDVSGHWAEAEIEKGYENKTVNGDPDGKFRPDDNITRAEFLKLLASCVCSNAQVEIPDEFGDESHWASKYYNFARAYMYIVMDTEIDGIKPGVMDSVEAYEKPITRWEMAFMVSQALENTLGAGMTAASIGFIDQDDITKYPEEIQADIAGCYALELMKGDEKNNFAPAAKGTRAEAVTVINRIDAYIKKTIATYEEEYAKAQQEYEKNITDNLVTYDKIPTGHPKATIVMENNKRIVIELYPEYAPQTVANFVKLAKEGFYNGLTFHRVIDGFMAQGGDPNGDGSGGSGKYIKGEFTANGFDKNTLSHTEGVISMARSDHPDSASCQFFICYGDATFLDGQYAAFGKVTAGMDVVKSFTEVEMEMNAAGEQASPKTPIKIKSITIK